MNERNTQNSRFGLDGPRANHDYSPARESYPRSSSSGPRVDWGQAPRMTRPGNVPAVLFSVFMWLSPLFLFASGIAAHFGIKNQEEATQIIAIILFALACATTITAVVFFLRIIYTGWKVVYPLKEQPEFSDLPSPGVVVGFLFIPFFNYYWMFAAYVGLAGRLNDYMSCNYLEDQRRASRGIAIMFTILTLVMFNGASLLLGFGIQEYLIAMRQGSGFDVSAILLGSYSALYITTLVFWFIYTLNIHSISREVFDSVRR